MLSSNSVTCVLQTASGELLSGAAGRSRLMNQQKTPPGANPAARKGRQKGRSGFDGIGTLSVFALGGYNRQPQLLPDGPGQEAADRMCLPACGFHEFGQGGPVLALKQGQDLGLLATVARRG